MDRLRGQLHRDGGGRQRRRGRFLAAKALRDPEFGSETPVNRNSFNSDRPGFFGGIAALVQSAN
jgi:hypothetical protein